MPSARPDTAPPPTVDAEIAELGRAHLARWLDEVLPPGPCLVWAGGTSLASLLAADGRRAVLLIEPATADLEAATRRGSPGVALGGPDHVHEYERFDSAVVVAGAIDPAPVLGPLLSGPLAQAAVAVVVEPEQVDATLAALAPRATPSAVVHQRARLSSAIGLEGGAGVADELFGTDADEPLTSVVLVGAVAHPSVLVGRDVGPARWWTEIDALRHAIRVVDTDLQAEDAVRLADLAERTAAAERRVDELEEHVEGLQRRIHDLEASTSWRVTAPLRWASERARRR